MVVFDKKMVDTNLKLVLGEVFIKHNYNVIKRLRPFKRNNNLEKLLILFIVKNKLPLPPKLHYLVTLILWQT